MRSFDSKASLQTGQLEYDYTLNQAIDILTFLKYVCYIRNKPDGCREEFELLLKLLLYKWDKNKHPTLLWE